MPLFNLNQNQQVTIPLPIPIELGGTGKTSRNFVDLDSSQTIDAPKNFTNLKIGANVPFKFNDSHSFGASFDNLGNGVFSGDSASIDGLMKGWHILTSSNARGGGFSVQMALSDTSTEVYYRRRAGGAWQPWQRIWTDYFGTPVWQAPSDKRLKNSIKPISTATALDLISQFNPVQFRYTAEVRKTGIFGDLKLRCQPHYGFLAQEIPLENLRLVKDDETIGINYIELIPFLVGAIQEMQKQIDQLKQQIAPTTN